MNLILTNARIYTCDPAQPWATALAIANDRIVAVGSDADMDGVRLPNAERINLNGAFVTPGLIDAHTHLLSTGYALQRIDLPREPARELAIETVRRRAATTPAGKWILGRGWVRVPWSADGTPTAADLDPATAAHPVALTAASGHALWVNSAALRQCGITASTPDPYGGQIVRDATGAPTGLLLEEALSLVYEKLPPFTPAEEETAVLGAMRAMNQAGLTGTHCMDGSGGIGSFQAYQRVRASHKQTLRVVKNLPAQDIEAVLGAGIRSGFGDAWLRVGGVKFFADGALGPRTALMIAPYENQPANYGMRTYEKEQLFEDIGRVNAAGLSAIVHAIGDQANRDVLDAMAAAAAGAAPGLRNRIEHCQVLHPDDIPRFAAQNIIASVQPIHTTQDMQVADLFWGARSKGAYAFRSLADSGARLAFGSDAPVEVFDPLVGLHAAVTRRRADGTPGPDGWYPEQRITIEEAIQAYTLGAAYAGGMEREIGSLEAGKYADLTVLSRDLTRIPGDEILGVKVERVMVGGGWVV